MTRTIDLNADVGEGVGNDAALIPLVTSANIACGAHAGDDTTMETAVRAAVNAGVAIGAHPGHTDREGFGRRAIEILPRGIEGLIAPQIQRLQTIAERCEATVRYIKLHGALYHQAANDARLAAALVAVVKRAGAGVALLGPGGTPLAEESAAVGIPFFTEGFADRRYHDSHSLLPRTATGAVLDQPGLVAEQAVRIALRGSVVTASGADAPIRCDSLCLHGDQANALGIARSVRNALQAAGVNFNAFTAAAE